MFISNCVGQCGGAVVSAVTSQLEGSGLKPGWVSSVWSSHVLLMPARAMYNLKFTPHKEVKGRGYANRPREIRGRIYRTL